MGCCLPLSSRLLSPTRGSVDGRNPGRLVRRHTEAPSRVSLANGPHFPSEPGGKLAQISAGSSPARGNLRQFATRLGRKVRTICQRNPRRGLCVPANQTPRIAPVHAPTSGRKKPRRKRQATAHARICDQRLDWILLDILRLHGGKHRQRGFAPFQCGANLRDAEGLRQHPEWEVRIIPVTRATESFNLQKGGEQAPELVLKLPNVPEDRKSTRLNSSHLGI